MILKVFACAGVLLATLGCATPQPDLSNIETAPFDGAILMGSYQRAANSYWINIPAGVAVENYGDGVFCGSIRSSKLNGSGDRICLYEGASSRSFDRAALYSSAGLLKVFTFDPPIPYRRTPGVFRRAS